PAPEAHMPWLPPTPPPTPAPPRWEPVPAQGHYIPAGEPGSNWVATPPPAPEPPAAEPPAAEPSAAEPPAVEPPQAGYVGRRRREEPVEPAGRHYAEPKAEPQPEPEPQPEEEDGGGAHTGGQSVAELLARLQATPAPGGRRRRREE
ncbi:DUF6779 domain-containing protein, partial [Mycolicibacterium vaccae]